MINKSLTAAGYSVFVDVNFLDGGDNFDLKIQDAVVECRAFVPLCSSEYGHTEYMRLEFCLAHKKGKTIIPLFHSGVFPPTPLELRMGSLNYVPKSGSVIASGGLKTWIEKVGKELIVALVNNGIHPSGHGLPNEGSAGQTNGPEKEKRVCKDLTGLAYDPSVVTHLELNLSEVKESPTKLSKLKILLFGCAGGELVSLKLICLDISLIKELASALKSMTGLQQLDVHSNSIGAEGASALASALKSMTGLQQLDLGDNSIGDEGASALASALKSMTGLDLIL